MQNMAQNGQPVEVTDFFRGPTPSFQWASLGFNKFNGFNNLLTSQITKSLVYTLPPIMVQWKMGPNKLKNEFSSLFPLWWCVLKKSILSHDCGIFLHITTKQSWVPSHFFRCRQRFYHHQQCHLILGRITTDPETLHEWPWFTYFPKN